MNIGITGAGEIGSCPAKKLVQLGHPVRQLFRNQQLLKNKND